MLKPCAIKEKGIVKDFWWEFYSKKDLDDVQNHINLIPIELIIGRIN